jgi:spore germination protein
MDIYVVQQGDTIDSIAEAYGVTANKLIIDNGITNINNLVTGQTIVIVYPNRTYIVQDGDTLNSIAENNGISLMQLLRNNPVLYEREYIYPGETLTISYETIKQCTTNGFVYPFVKEEVLKRTLPYLTFLSLFNYRVAERGNIVTYGDDTKLIQLAKTYGTIPLLMISSLSTLGEPNPEVSYEILINKEYQNYLISNVIRIMEEKGFQGVNLLISLLNESNQQLYVDFITNISDQIASRGYSLFVTINPQIQGDENNTNFLSLDYETIRQLCYSLTFLQYYWGINTNPPAPVTSITSLRSFMDYVVTETSTTNIAIGIPVLAYDWTLPFTPNKSAANVMTINSALSLASDTRSEIYFDSFSYTPYFNYTNSYVGELEEHIVWSLDARTIRALDEIIIDYDLSGSGIWNIMVYYQQMWTVINSRLEIIKLVPDQLS